MNRIDINRVVAKFEKRVGELSTQNVLLEAQVEALLEQQRQGSQPADGGTQEHLDTTAPLPADEATE